MEDQITIRVRRRRVRQSCWDGGESVTKLFPQYINIADIFLIQQDVNVTSRKIPIFNQFVVQNNIVFFSLISFFTRYCSPFLCVQVYPTTMRAVGLGTASGVGRIGATVTPLVAQVTSKHSIQTPIYIYAVCGIVACICSLLLPIETRGRQMKVRALPF